jgi:hypothetical protein
MLIEKETIIYFIIHLDYRLYSPRYVRYTIQDKGCKHWRVLQYMYSNEPSQSLDSEGGPLSIPSDLTTDVRRRRLGIA